MLSAALVRPRAESVDLALLPDRDGQILMPDDLPIGARRLVEEERANGESILSEHALDGSSHQQ